MKHGEPNGVAADVASARPEQEFLEWASRNDLESLRAQQRDDIARACDKYGSTALHYAAGSGALEVCRFLLSSPGASVPRCLVDPLVPSSNNGRTALHWAARNGHTEVCRLLVTGGSGPATPVDVLAKGEVTPLQLAIWQAHLETARVLVHELGADPHFINAWGCGVPHWLAKCPLYSFYVSGKSELASGSNVVNDDSEKEGRDIRNHLQACCQWLFEDCRVKTWSQPNHHGQTPLHKAAYDGNAPLVEYLVKQYGIIDDQRDHQGNTAADCAERSPNYDPKALGVAQWLRRHASPLRIKALKTMGLLCRDTNSGREAEPLPKKSCSIVVMPTLEELRSTYHRLARQYHPDRHKRVVVQAKNEATTTIETVEEHWNAIQDAYQLLSDWWQAPPLVYDLQIRYLSRNAALRDYPPILWHQEWHERLQQRFKQPSNRHIPNHLPNQSREISNQEIQRDQIGRKKADRSFSPMKQAALEEFERRLVSLLLTAAHSNQGLALAQLPKEYSKNFGAAPLIAEAEERSLDPTGPDLTKKKKKMPKQIKEHALPINPKDYHCRKLTHLLLQHCPNIHVDMGQDKDGNQTSQPRVYAKMMFEDRQQHQ